MGLIKICQHKKFWAKEKIRPKILDPKIFGPEKFVSTKRIGPNKIFTSRKCLTQKQCFNAKKFRTQNFSDNRKCWVQNNFELKKIWALNFWTQWIFGPKHSCPTGAQLIISAHMIYTSDDQLGPLCGLFRRQQASVYLVMSVGRSSKYFENLKKWGFVTILMWTMYEGLHTILKLWWRSRTG